SAPLPTMQLRLREPASQHPAASPETAARQPNLRLSPADTGATTTVASDQAGDSGGDTSATAGDAEATTAVGEATADRDTYIWAQHLAGRSTREISAVVGLHHGTVARIVARLKTEHGADESGGEEGTTSVLTVVR
ncbi:hypothetical protein, partial [Nocardia sp. NPDC004722]